MSPHTNYHEQLNRIERLACGGIAARFAHHPLRYLSAIGFWRILYPLRKRGKYAEARTFFGSKMQVILPSATEIYLFGAKTHDSEIRLARFLLNSLKPGDVFCDIGAHFGYFTLLASTLLGREGRVVAIEASKSTYGILKQNTECHENITTLHRAATDSNEKLVFHEFPALYSEYNSLVLPNAQFAGWMKNNPPTRMEVEGMRLDEYFEEKKLFPSVIKIDVEGAEPRVIGGLEGYLKGASPLVVMEYLTGDVQRDAHERALEMAKNLGYQTYILEKDGTMTACTDIGQSIRERGLDSDNIVFKKVKPLR